jgi:predicted nucleic acid-binding protein
LTDSLFFDNDCLSAFLWVGCENLLVKLYSGKIIIPKAVYDELSIPNISHLKMRMDALISAGNAQIMTIKSGTEAYNLYYRLAFKPEKGNVVIGKGEAASIALAKTNAGILASNNLKDIASYVEKMNLKHLTTGDILIAALEKNLITEPQGNKIWSGYACQEKKVRGIIVDRLHTEHFQVRVTVRVRRKNE